MKRRAFIKTTGAISLATGISLDKVFGFVPAHNWEKYDFGPGPEVKDQPARQGPLYTAL
jgi:hypothetical protein